MLWDGLLAKEMEFLQLSGSCLLMSITDVMSAFVTMLFAGQIDQAHLDGIGLANTFYNIVIMSITAGYGSVFDTYGPQVYGSNKDSKDRGQLSRVLVKCIFQIGLVNIAIIGPYLNLVYIIDLLPHAGLDDESSDFRVLSVEYLRLTVVCEFIVSVCRLVLQYFNIQEHTKLVYGICISSMGIHVLLNYLFVSVMGLKLYGVALASILSRLCMLAMSIVALFVMVKRGHFVWGKIGWDVLTGWKTMLLMGSSGAVNIFSEVFLYEISTFCSQFLNSDSLSVVLISIQVCSVLWALAFGITRTAGILMGRSLGEGDKDGIKQYFILGALHHTINVLPIAIFGYFMRSSIVKIFTQVPNVVNLFVDAFPIYCFFSYPMNILQIFINQGVLIAFGEQRFIAWSLSIASYVVGLPIVLVSIFFSDLNISGIYIGWAMIDVVAFMASAVKAKMMNIDKEIEKCRIRVSNDNQTQEEQDAVGFDNPIYSADNGNVEMSQDKVETEYAVTFLVDESESKITSQSKEPKMVLIAFIVMTIICLILSGISLLKK